MARRKKPSIRARMAKAKQAREGEWTAHACGHNVEHGVPNGRWMVMDGNGHMAAYICSPSDSRNERMAKLIVRAVNALPPSERTAS